jgi:hypothetical protein
MAPPAFYQQLQQLASWYDQGTQFMAAGQFDAAFSYFASCLNALGSNVPDSVLIRMGLCKLHIATEACIVSLQAWAETSRQDNNDPTGLWIGGQHISSAEIERKQQSLQRADNAHKALLSAVQEATYYFQLVQQRYPGYAYPQVQEFIAEAQGLCQLYERRAEGFVQIEQDRARSMTRAARWAEAYAYGEIAHARHQIEFNKRLAEDARDYAKARHDELSAMAAAKASTGDYQGAASAAAWLEQYALDYTRSQKLVDSVNEALRRTSRR